MERQLLVDLVRRLGDEKMDNLRIEASEQGNLKDAKDEMRGFTRGDLIAKIVDHRLGDAE